MKIISHRVNTKFELANTPRNLGVEVDIRSDSGRLIIHHDPLVRGEDFEEWISLYRHGLLILNVKEEGLESTLVDCMERHGIKDFFFLDQSFPFLVKWANMGERRCAIRISEYESVATALTLSGKIEWAWVDCFTKFPLSLNDYKKLKDLNFKLCLVSPELQGRNPDTEIPLLRTYLADQGMKMDAVCTKQPSLWDI